MPSRAIHSTHQALAADPDPPRLLHDRRYLPRVAGELAFGVVRSAVRGASSLTIGFAFFLLFYIIDHRLAYRRVHVLWASQCFWGGPPCCVYACVLTCADYGQVRHGCQVCRHHPHRDGISNCLFSRKCLSPRVGPLFSRVLSVRASWLSVVSFVVHLASPPPSLYTKTIKFWPCRPWCLPWSLVSPLCDHGLEELPPAPRMLARALFFVAPPPPPLFNQTKATIPIAHSRHLSHSSIKEMALVRARPTNTTTIFVRFETTCFEMAAQPPWYHGPLPTTAAEGLLKRHGMSDGMFLVRMNRDAQNVLSLCHGVSALWGRMCGVCVRERSRTNPLAFSSIPLNSLFFVLSHPFC
jgi:hypothetical protein